MPKHWFILLCLLLALPFAALADKEYLLGPQDVIDITVFGETDLSKTVVIGANGTVRLPLLREVELQGLTVRQAEKKLEELLGERFLKDPNVSIVVKEYMSQRVYVLGAVKKPGYYPLMGDMSLLDIVSKAGGTTADGGKKFILIRGGAKKEEDLQKILKAEKDANTAPEDFTRDQTNGVEVIDGHKLLEEGDISLNRALQSGDVVYIPKVQQVFVLGEVKRPGGIPYTNGLTLLKAVTLAGGLTEMAKKKVIVIRMKNGKQEKFKVNVKAIIKDISKDVPLMPDDQIIVNRRIF